MKLLSRAKSRLTVTGRQRPVLEKASAGQGGKDRAGTYNTQVQIWGRAWIWARLKASHHSYGHGTFGPGECDYIIQCLQKWKSPQMAEVKELEWRDNLQR